jgi:hypothetical protein
MARASNIYHVYNGDNLLASFTVKYEMLAWAKRSGHGSADLRCERVRDGRPEDGWVLVPWEEEWERPMGKAQAVAKKLAQHFIKTGQMGG